MNPLENILQEDLVNNRVPVILSNQSSCDQQRQKYTFTIKYGVLSKNMIVIGTLESGNSTSAQA